MRNTNLNMNVGVLTMQKIENLKLELSTLKSGLEAAKRMGDVDYYQSTQMAIEGVEEKLKHSREILRQVKASQKEITGD